MGVLYGLHCRKCGYKTRISLGVWFAYPAVYCETQEKGKRGDFGKDVKQFFIDHPDGVIDPCTMIALCGECGEYYSVSALTMYVPDDTKEPKKKSGIRWSVAAPFYDTDYIAPYEFEEYYKLYKKFAHKCSHCNGKLKLFPEEEIKKLKCPRCEDNYLVAKEIILWD